MRHKLPYVLLNFLLILQPTQSQAEQVLRFAAPTGAVIQDTSILVLTEAYSKLGISFSVSRYPNERALIYANKGKADGDVSRIKGLQKKYTNLVPVPVAINFLEGYAFSNNKDLKITDWESLKNYRITCVRGIKFVENNLKKRGIECQYVGRFQQALELLSLNRADVTVFPRIVGINAIRQFKKDGINTVGTRLKKIELYHYLNIKHQALVPKLKSILLEMKAQGRFEEIRNQYLLENNY